MPCLQLDAPTTALFKTFFFPAQNERVRQKVCRVICTNPTSHRWRWSCITSTVDGVGPSLPTHVRCSRTRAAEHAKIVPHHRSHLLDSPRRRCSNALASALRKSNSAHITQDPIVLCGFFSTPGIRTPLNTSTGHMLTPPVVLASGFAPWRSCSKPQQPSPPTPTALSRPWPR